MIELLGKEYITTREASKRYGFSSSWFNNIRIYGEGPPCIKVRHKVLYPILEVDEWFKQSIKKFDE